MDVLVGFLTLICYGLAVYLWWRYRTPVYLIALLSGHLAALASPLWSVLYGVVYRPDLAVFTTLLEQPLPRMLVVAAAWFYPLPALLVHFLYLSRWWFPGYLSGLLTFGAFLLYHLIMEMLGLRANIWSYTATDLPFGFPTTLLSAVMGALVSLALLYVLLATYRYAWTSMALVLLPATLALSLLIHGLLGAPLWVALLLDAERWAASIGMLSTLALLAWAIHIVTNGLRRVDQGLAA